MLVVVDQFEELFRFQDAGAGLDGADSPAFVRLLIEAVADESNVSVILTMRSDYLGDCSQFDQLPETINQGLYLFPGSPARNSAWRSPVQCRRGGEVASSCATAPERRRRDPDQLPVLQHALMRMWDLWTDDVTAPGPIDFEHYEAAGGLEDARPACRRGI